MFTKVAKDRKATKAEKKAAVKAGKDPDSINTGDGDNVLTKAEFIKNFEKKVQVFNWVNNKKEKVVVKSPELLFNAADKQGKADDKLSVEEFVDLVLLIRSRDPDKKLELAFHMCDTNGSGSLDKVEVENMLMGLVGADQDAAARDKMPELIEKFMQKADGSYEGSAQQMAESGKGDGKITLEEMKKVLGPGGECCGWMDEYIGRKMTKVEVVDQAFSGKSSACLVM